ncbi:MAG: lysoplasmalogenase [bacterium]|nr:lysoplasmalogenase [bacterium]
MARVAAGVLTILVYIGVFGMVTAWCTDRLDNAMPWVYMASTSYVLIGVLGGGLRSTFGRLILVALVLCWMGDVFGPGNFIMGLGAFLLAHLALIPAFAVHGVQWKRAALSSILVLPISAGLFVWLFPHVPVCQQAPVIAYLLVISAMTTAAFGLRRGPARLLLILAAIAFYFSDILVAKTAFIDQGERELLTTAVDYPIYYGSCVLFAFSVFARER